MRAIIPHSRPTLGARELRAVSTRVESLIVGENSLARRALSTLLARWGAPHGILTSSGTQALLAALSALEVSEGDEVICSTYVCAEVAAAIEHIGAVPILVDIADDYLVDCVDVARKLTSRTRAIIDPFLMGIERQNDDIYGLGVPVITDCAQYGAEKLRSHQIKGDFIVLSFEATKMLTSGEGGAVLTRNAELGLHLESLKHFRDSPYKCNLYPFSDLQAALLDVQLERLDEFLECRRMLANNYTRALESSTWLSLPAEQVANSAFFRYPVRIAHIGHEELQAGVAMCEKRGVAFRQPVDSLLHQLLNVPGSFPVAEQLFGETISIPLYPSLTSEEQGHIIATFLDVFSSLSNLGAT
jgi:dTDP-4-amino-4,6-dideoxygalactose transaminase